MTQPSLPVPKTALCAAYTALPPAAMSNSFPCGKQLPISRR